MLSSYQSCIIGFDQSPARARQRGSNRAARQSRLRGDFVIRHPGIPQQQRLTVSRRSEEHTSELQSPCNLVCRLLLEKKKQTTTPRYRSTTVEDAGSLLSARCA